MEIKINYHEFFEMLRKSKGYPRSYYGYAPFYI